MGTVVPIEGWAGEREGISTSSPQPFEHFVCVCVLLKNSKKKNCGEETNDLVLEDQKGCIRGCEEFEYLKVITQMRYHDNIQ